MIKSSITDIPRDVAREEKDNFGIEPFEKGLTKFIEHTNTPITVALQGEWGSGKTSLMNSLKMSLSDGKNSKYHSVWLNTWEFALMKDASSTLIDIITGLIDETTKIANVDESQKQKILKTLWGGLKKAGKVVVKNAADKVIDGAGSIVDAFDNEGKSSIGLVRTELEEIIEDCIKKDNKLGFIFFIDDLDRIDPPVAVQLLELLKNIFTLKNCVFVLAIDYDVVIKGLEPKFGKLTDQNEREFRSFFDKIIQVPFSMPVSSYKVNDFLRDSLLSIDYINDTQAKNIDMITAFSEISNLSVGTNPRGLKRLMNSLSLISCINIAKGNTHDNEQLNNDLEILVNFALVSIQIAYPPVYRLLSMHSAFDKWDENVALQMNLNPLDEESIKKLNLSKEFDDDWEKVLFRLCENDHYLKKRALNISRLLNSLKTSINAKEEEVEDIIGAVISLSSVTSLEAFDQPVVDYHRGNLLKSIRERIFPKLREKLPQYKNDIKQKGSRIQTNFRFFLKPQMEYHMQSYPKDGQINLGFNTAVWFGKTNKDFKTDMNDSGIAAEFDLIAKEYTSYFVANSPIITYDLWNANTYGNDYYLHFYNDYLLLKPEDFKTSETTEIITNHITKQLEFRDRMFKLAKKRIGNK